jgi:hypothetical protein
LAKDNFWDKELVSLSIKKEAKVLEIPIPRNKQQINIKRKTKKKKMINDRIFKSLEKFPMIGI